MSNAHRALPWDEPPARQSARIEPLPGADSLAHTPPSVPLQWQLVSPELRPYRDYRDEYLRSPFELDALTLAYRWTGITPAQEIYAFYQWPELQDDRWKAQNAYADATDPGWKLRWNQVMIQRFLGLLENAMAKLRTGGDFEYVKGEYAFMPLSARKRDSLTKEVVYFFQQIRLLQGESTEIIEKRGLGEGGGSIGELLAQGMAKLPPEVRGVMNVSLTLENEAVPSRSLDDPDFDLSGLYDALPRPDDPEPR